jgi:hypothetical protein
MPLELTQGHRALRHKAFNGVEDFCLVYFKPDPTKIFINECPHYKKVLESGIEICNHRYHLFGLSNSQLREHSYWFVRATSLEEIDRKRRLLGDFSEITNIGKYVARVGLWFSKSDPTNVCHFIQLDVYSFCFSFTMVRFNWSILKTQKILIAEWNRVICV